MRRNWYLLILGLLFGCSSKPPHPRWLWPPPPATPRLEFIRTFSSEIDLLPDRKQRVVSSLSGQAGDEEIFFPFGLVAGRNKTLYLADQDKRSLRAYDLETGRVSTLGGGAELKEPLDLARTPTGDLLLIDGRRVLRFSAEGAATVLIPEKQLQNPAYLEINPGLQRIYISDSKTNTVEVFTFSGSRLFSIGKHGSATGEFFAPQGIAIDAEGRVFVADHFNARIQVFDAEGQYLRQFGQRGTGPSDFEGPKDLAFDSEGHLHIVDSRRNALLTFSPTGQLLLITGGGSGTGHPLGFNGPAAIHIDAKDRIYISDRLNHRVSIWQYLNPAYLKEHPVTEKDLKALNDFMGQQ